MDFNIAAFLSAPDSPKERGGEVEGMLLDMLMKSPLWEGDELTFQKVLGCIPFHTRGKGDDTYRKYVSESLSPLLQADPFLEATVQTADQVRPIYSIQNRHFYYYFIRLIFWKNYILYKY